MPSMLLIINLIEMNNMNGEQLSGHQGIGLHYIVAC